MKKWLIAALLIVLAILIAVSVFLVVRFLAVYDETEPDTTKETAASSDIAGYAMEQWPDYQISYDPASDVLTLSKETALNYESACAYGGSVYEGELAPATFRQDAASIALDVAARCGRPALTVTLCYLSSDGKPIFTVDSGGSVWTCWETEKP
ncbi:MAG: hypothetical protein IJJ99_07660 [Oscillospiraceae bacterium]|nr:hypothetical protein [Oscillospiraceae bacterium]